MTEVPNSATGLEHLLRLDHLRATPPARHRETQPELPAADPPRWIWEAMDPQERRNQLQCLRDWITWMTDRYQEPPTDLTETIPSCWFLHPGPLDRLTAVYTEWLRVYATDNQLPIPSFFDAFDRHAATLGFPGRCIKGHHEDLPGAEPIPDWNIWLTTSVFATAPAQQLEFARISTPRPEPMDVMWPPLDTLKTSTVAGDEMAQLIADGHAKPLGGAPAVSYDGDFWIRVTDPEVMQEMGGAAGQLEAADETAAIPEEDS